MRLLQARFQAVTGHGTLRAPAAIALPSAAAYGGCVPTLRDDAMAARSTRYRLTITPIEKDGLQCSGRCTIEVEHRAQQDWMRLLENAPRLSGFGSDERAAVLVAAQILRDVLDRHQEDPSHPLAADTAAITAALDALDALHRPKAPTAG